MDRRKFLRQGALAGLTVTAISAGSCQGAAAPAGTTPDPKPGAGNIPPAFDLDEITIEDLQQKMEKGLWTARTAAEAYLKRIGELDRQGPNLHAVIELNPDALAIADERDRERKAGKVRGPLHGIPMLVKDNINTGDAMLTTAGALALQGNKAAKDATIIAQLREAGAVLLGKTNLSEWANFRSNRSTSGWSGRGGQTRCPYALDRNPSGSSSGSGAAVAANLCTLAIGTETDGSIVSPASVNGLVGIKPTVGLWSRSGIIPISKTQDTAGPMARTLRDAVILLAACAGADPADAATQSRPAGLPVSYLPYLDPEGLKGKRIGVEKSFLSGSQKMVALFREGIEVLKKKGATVVEIELLKAMEKIGPAEYLVLQYEFKDGVNQYLSSAASPVKTLQQVIDYNKAHATESMPFFEQETLELCQGRGGLDTAEYLKALEESHSGSRKIIDEFLKKEKLDAICGVTNGPACYIDEVNGDYDTGFSFSAPAARAGYPHITIPLGQVMGLPIGFSFTGTAYAEPALIAMAYSFEQATHKREAPKFIPHG